MIACGRVWRERVCLPLIAVGLAISGCSFSDDGVSKRAIAGTVLLDGRRLAHGVIVFEPEKRPVKGDGSTTTGDVILNGRFSIPPRKGLVPGLYKILIFTEPTHQQFAGKLVAPAPETIPARFNMDTVLELEFNERIKDVRIEIDSK